MGKGRWRGEEHEPKAGKERTEVGTSGQVGKCGRCGEKEGYAT